MIAPEGMRTTQDVLSEARRHEELGLDRGVLGVIDHDAKAGQTGRVGAADAGMFGAEGDDTVDLGHGAALNEDLAGPRAMADRGADRCRRR